MNYTKIVMYLLFFVAIKNIKASEYPMTLHQACKDNDIKTIKTLLKKKKINPNERDAKGYTPLIYACKQGHVESVKLLLAHPKTDINYKSLYIKIVDRKPYGQEKIIHKEEDATPLFCACKKGRVEVVEYLLHYPGIDINAQNYQRKTPLHEVCGQNNIDLAKLLLMQPNIDVNIKTNCQETALHLACYRNNIDLVNLLLLKNPDFTIQSPIAVYSGTPLHIAACKSISIMNTLLAHGAPISDKNYFYKTTALYIAYKNKIITDINQLICKENDLVNRSNFLNKELHAASLSRSSKHDTLTNFIDWCIKNGADLNARDSENLRPVDRVERYFYKHIHDGYVGDVEKNYHIFLKATPRCSKLELYKRLKANFFILDFANK